jgi:hypothetical protein
LIEMAAGDTTACSTPIARKQWSINQRIPGENDCRDIGNASGPDAFGSGHESFETMIRGLTPFVPTRLFRGTPQKE